MNVLLLTPLFKIITRLMKIFPEKLGNAVSFHWLLNMKVKGKVTAEVYPGVFMDLDLGDWLQRFYYLGFVDRQKISLIKSLIPKGGVFVDVGANVGLYTCSMANYLSSDGGTVIAFEPMLECLDQLYSNIELNRLQNVDVRPLALSNQIGKFDLYLPTKHPGGPSGATQVWNPGGWKTVGSALSTTLDAVFSNDRLDFIKIDVQGHEVNVLEGARNVIARFRPVIVCEVETHNRAAVLNFAKDHGYNIFIEKDGTLKSQLPESGCFDFFLIPNK